MLKLSKLRSFRKDKEIYYFDVLYICKRLDEETLEIFNVFSALEKFGKEVNRTV